MSLTPPAKHSGHFVQTTNESSIGMHNPWLCPCIIACLVGSNMSWAIFTQAMHTHQLWNRHLFSLVDARREPLASGDGAANSPPHHRETPCRLPHACFRVASVIPWPSAPSRPVP